MTFVEDFNYSEQLTTRQRWGNVFVIVLGIVSLIIAWNLRLSIENQTSQYQNNEIGIAASYPSEWLLEDNLDDAVFSVRNIQERGFKTTFTVYVQPIGQETTKRTIFDALTMQRSQTLAAYRVLEIDTYTTNNNLVLDAATYTYVDTAATPFLEIIPTVVLGMDIIIFSNEQAIIISIVSDADHFQNNLPLFDRFVTSLEF